MHRFFTPAVLALAALASPALAADPSPVAPHPCKIEGVEVDVRCATLPVWENRETKTGRKIPINVVILPALGAEKLPDPIFYLAGGPGQGAATTAEGWARAKELRARRDIVLIDQRGTGGSNRLDCKMFGEPTDLKLLASEFLKKSSVEQCRAELEKHADLAQYNTEYSVDDFDEVRAWLGYGKVNLFGGSYGTTSAQVYMRRHPGSIRAVILDGVAPVDEPIPLHHAAAGQRAVDLLFAECAADAACHAAFPNPGAELKEVMARVEKGVEVEVSDPRTKQLMKVRANRGVVAEGIRLFLYSVEEDGKNSLPLRIHRAFLGDFRPLVESALASRLGLERAIDEGMWLSLTCAEDIPFITPSMAEKETANTYLGDFRVRTQTEACKVWPRSKISPGYRDLVRSDLPVLMISGERDPVTPPSFGERVAHGFPNGLHLIVPHGGHGADNDCVNGITLKFLDQASVKGLDTSCVAKSEPAKFSLQLPREKG
ncbi:MAG TPA: alpha/beta hydrolase [Thermoanaerobaculia bacterium]|jgi:pimeloyl-ACP methyl ester carboxylesterase|nr:alpha/beta hydrolase [Thermoanaerobaculia bacterium]